jgi:hypothetical protein
MTKTKQKTQDQNGTAVAPEIDLEAAQRAINEAERQKRQRYMIEVERLSQEYGYKLVPRPFLTDDGRTDAMIEVQKAK